MPPKPRPRPYATVDRAYLAQDTIRDLGDEYGPAGPLTFLAIVLAGGGLTATLPPGIVELRYRALAREAFTQAKTVRQIVTTCVELGLLDEFAEQDSGRFRARLTKHEKWDAPPLTDAERAARYRAKRAASDP